MSERWNNDGGKGNYSPTQDTIFLAILAKSATHRRMTLSPPDWKCRVPNTRMPTRLGDTFLPLAG
jgi:hypothetical protein